MTGVVLALLGQLMRILLVANYELDAQQSMQRYADWLSHALIKQGHTVQVTRPSPFFARLTFGKFSTIQKYLGYLDKFFLFPPKLRTMALNFELVHVVDHSNSMYLNAVRNCPTLITCHDLLAIRAALGEFPETKTGWSGRILQRWILKGLLQASNVVCVSEKTANDLVTLIDHSSYATTNKNIRVIFNALNWPFRPSAAMPHFDGVDRDARTALNFGAPYLLHVGGNQWYKNRLGAIKIYAELRNYPDFENVRLIMAGKPWTPAMREFVCKHNLEAWVIELGTMSSEELQSLYSHALALLFPSLEEGFGWPIVEAQACGCPVITTARPPMNEVAGAGYHVVEQGAILVEPGDPARAAELIDKGLKNREALIVAGLKNIMRYDEAFIVSAYCDFYSSIRSHERR